MPRPRKGPRLYLRPARPEKRQAAGWVIKDGDRELGTGCGPDDVAGAEIELGLYIAEKHRPEPTPAPRGGASDPAQILISDVLNLYAAERGPRLADPVSASYRIESLLAWWCDPAAAAHPDDARDGTLASIRRSTSRAYVDWRTAQRVRGYSRNPAAAPFVSDQSARRELEDLSAAVGWFHAEHPLTRQPSVTLPPKAESPRDALTRDQAARLLKAAMGWRWTPHAPDGTGEGRGGWIRPEGPARANRRHLRRLLLIGLYTGTRPGVIGQLLWSESPTQAWVDLDKGMIYRRGREERDRPTKRRPVVSLPPRLLAHLRRWRELDRREQGRLLQAHIDAGRDPADAPRISTVLHFAGRPITGRIRTGWESIVADAGVDGAALDSTPHWMRHTAATWLMEADCPSWEAAGYMGMSMKTLEDHYGHHRPSHQSAARRAAGGRRGT